jgi:hypothetical protein
MKTIDDVSAAVDAIEGLKNLTQKHAQLFEVLFKKLDALEKRLDAVSEIVRMK